MPKLACLFKVGAKKWWRIMQLRIKSLQLNSATLTFRERASPRNVITSRGTVGKKKGKENSNIYRAQAFTVDGFSKSSPTPPTQPPRCSGLRMALLSCCNALPYRTPPPPIQQRWRPPRSETRALTEDALILQALITGVSS